MAGLCAELLLTVLVVLPSQWTMLCPAPRVVFPPFVITRSDTSLLVCWLRCATRSRWNPNYSLSVIQTHSFMLLLTPRMVHDWIPYSGYTVRGQISAKHQFLFPAVISAIAISARQSYTKSRDHVKIVTSAWSWILYYRLYDQSLQG